LDVGAIHPSRQEQAAAVQGIGARGRIRCGKPDRKSFGRSGKPRYLGFVGGKLVWVVVALDEPDLIVTIFPKERG
jgi:hypothetical protein